MKRSLILLPLALFSLGSAEGKLLKWGGRAWTLTIEGDEAFVRADNWYIPWCFEGLRGKTATKRLELKVTMADGQPQITPLRVAPDKDDHDLLICLDSAWKVMPLEKVFPRDRPEERQFVLTFSKARR